MRPSCVSVCLLLAGVTTAVAQSRPSEVTGDPNDPAKTRILITREDRERLGLNPKNWTGVVHPDVYTRVEELPRTVASLKERFKKDKDEESFVMLLRVEFEGTVYVQVQLKSKDAQRRVLASLKASEFHAKYLFEGPAGMVGYITKEGVDKLARNPDVTGVCLDDKPIPNAGPKIIAKDSLPPPKPGDTSSEQPGVKEGKFIVRLS